MNSYPDTEVNKKGGGPLLFCQELLRHLLKTHGGAQTNTCPSARGEGKHRWEKEIERTGA